MFSRLLQYNNDLGNPVPLSDKNATLDWLLGFAVKLEYGDNGRCRSKLSGRR